MSLRTIVSVTLVDNDDDDYYYYGDDQLKGGSRIQYVRVKSRDLGGTKSGYELCIVSVIIILFLIIAIFQTAKLILGCRGMYRGVYRMSQPVVNLPCEPAEQKQYEYLPPVNREYIVFHCAQFLVFVHLKAIQSGSSLRLRHQTYNCAR